MPNCLKDRASAPTRLALGGRRATVALYGLAAFFYWISLYLYAPTLPTYVESKSETLTLVGIVLAQYGLWQAVIRLPLGVTGDWLGRHRPLILVGFALSGVGALTMGLAQGVAQLGIGRAITGLAAGTWVPLIVAFSGFFPPHEAVRATTLLTFIGSVGRVLATSVTGLLNDLGGYRLAFFLAASAAALSIPAMLLTQERRRPPNRPSLEGIGRLVTRCDVLSPSLLAAISQYTNWTATFSFLPILAQELGATDVTLSLLLTLHIGVATIGNLLASAIVDRVGARRLVYFSFVLLSAGLGLAALAPTLGGVFLAQTVIGVSQGVGYPVLMGLSIRYVSDDNRTTAMGLHQAVYAIGMFSGPWLSGMLADAMGIQSMFGVTAAACLLPGLLITRRLPEKE